MEIINLNPNFSTTRLVTKEKPVIENDPSSKVQSLLFLPPNPERKGEGGLRTQGYFKHSYNEANGLSNNSPLPLVTIITVVFNGEKYLEQTIQSVINQTYDNVEYIVIDGGSTDGTVDIIRKYEEQIDYWVSEPDEGLYFAMNKGISLASGEVIAILNSGDWYELDAIKNSLKALVSCDADYTYGKVYLVDELGERFGMSLVADNQDFNSEIYYRTVFLQLSAFIKKYVYLKLGGFDTNYKVSADHEFFLRMTLNNYKGFNTNLFIGNFRPAGASGNTQCTRESRNIALKYGKSKLSVYYRYYLFLFNGYLARTLPKKIVVFLKKFKKSRYYQWSLEEHLFK
jgi:glycosyltransferase involved in cell wall biosynthesis